MKKVALIGAGQLGSRHLQGIAKSSIDIEVEVIEPFLGSRKIAEDRFNEIEKNEKIIKINFYESIDELSSELDLVIIATNADVRFKVLLELVEKKKVENLVLEKVLFQKLEEYPKVEELLVKNNISCWVNHPRRMFSFYKELKEKLKGASRINFNVSGGSWGLGCNGLHFLDCFTYLSSKNDITMNLDLLDKKLYSTKRDGFSEYNGMITGNIEQHTFSLNCFPNNISPIEFSITSDKLNVFIDETNGWYKISEKDNDWISEAKNEKIIYFQSELTNILIENIFNNKCFLPTYEEAMKLHMIYLDNLISHTNMFNKEQLKICPIT